MGKTDIRDPDEVASSTHGVSYRAFDLLEAGAERIQEMLREVIGLFGCGVFTHPPITTWDVRRGVEAFRFLGSHDTQARSCCAFPSRRTRRARC